MSAQAAPQQKPETSRAAQDLEKEFCDVLQHYSKRVTPGDVVSVCLRVMNGTLVANGSLRSRTDIAGLMAILSAEFTSLGQIITAPPTKERAGAPGVS